MEPKQKPEGMTDEHLTYLDDLRESGVTNMFGAWRWLVDEQGVTESDAKQYQKYWMETFAKRNQKGEQK